MEPALFQEISRLANEALEADRYADAISLWKTLLVTFPAPRTAWARAGICLCGIGEAYFRQEKFADARIWFEQAVSCPVSVEHPSSAAFYNLRLGSCWFELKHTDKALPYLKVAFKQGGKELFQWENPAYL